MTPTTPQQTGAAEAENPPTDTAPESIEIPLASLPTPPKEGDTITLKVISVDEQAGVVNAVPDQQEETAEGEGGSDQLASEFNQKPE